MGAPPPNPWRSRFACSALLLAACGGEPYPSVDCHQVVWVRPARPDAAVEVVGSWDGWRSPGTAAEPAQDGWVGVLLSLPPGEYGYRVVADGVSSLDRYQPLSTFRGDEEVSLLVAPDCAAPAIRIDRAIATDDGRLSLAGTFVAASGGPPLDPAGLRVTIDGAPAPAADLRATPRAGTFTASASGLAAGKHAITVEAAGASGSGSAWVRPAAAAWSDGVLYQIVVDRYRGDGGAPLPPPATPGTRAGGTLSGVTAEIERGTFAELGVTALWLSPVYTNPDDFRLGRDGHPSQGYHGYWPLADRGVDPHLGGEAALDALIASAHRHGLRVLFDLVPNHVYEQNPRYQQHRRDGSFNDGPGACVCGDPGCGWGEHLGTCWFTPYLPDVRWEDDAAMRAGVDDALFWMSRFDADGVRIDAVPMIPRAATRRIVRALRDSVAPRGALFSVGEVFTGPGQGGIDTIKYFLGPDGLDSAFDFPLMWAVRDAIAHGGAGFSAVEGVLAATEEALAGSGAVSARMIDNHDTSRFVTEAAGEGGADPWASPPPQPSDPGVYARQRLALGLLFALPGLPVLYYGDEVALAGASDPDSRRVMPAEDALSAEQRATREMVKRLGALRRCSKALRAGARVPVASGSDTYAFARDAGDGAPALALFSRATSATTIAIPGGVVPPGEYVDAVTSDPVSLGGAAAIPMAPLSFKLLTPSKSHCP
jgi:glycosidase